MKTSLDSRKRRHNGRRSSVGRAAVCKTVCRGFESRPDLHGAYAAPDARSGNLLIYPKLTAGKDRPPGLSHTRRLYGTAGCGTHPYCATEDAGSSPACPTNAKAMCGAWLGAYALPGRLDPANPYFYNSSDRHPGKTGPRRAESRYQGAFLLRSCSPHKS